MEFRRDYRIYVAKKEDSQRENRVRTKNTHADRFICFFVLLIRVFLFTRSSHIQTLLGRESLAGAIN